MKAGKVWGTTERIFAMNNVEVHRITVVPGGYCSRHYHLHKSNLFFVESGKLVVEQWTKEGHCDRTILLPGERMVVPPGMVHKFECPVQTIAYEIYAVDLDPDDIVRHSTGGVQ
jgi:mannose-6-phosphate isomerase-like protein (cupin superfamily)